MCHTGGARTEETSKENSRNCLMVPKMEVDSRVSAHAEAPYGDVSHYGHTSQHDATVQNVIFPAPPRRVSRRAAPRVEEAIMVAIDLLEEQGEQGFRISSVKDRTGISIGSLYHHFGSRDGLIKAARAHQLAEAFRSDGEAVTEIALRARTVGEFISRVRDTAVAMVSPEGEQHRLHRIEFIGSAVSRPDLFATVQEMQTAAVDHLEECTRTLAERGWLRPGITPRALATLLLAVGLGRAISDIDLHRPSAEEWAEGIAVSLGALLAEPGDASG